MKYALIIPDGSADEAQEALGQKTPLEAANLPAMDAVAASGVVGRSNNTPLQLPAGSDTANLSLLGYNPLENFTGRAPLEAAAQGIELGPGDWAIRCNLVTIQDQVMRSFTAGHISSAEAAALIQTAQRKIGGDQWQFYAGVSYRNLVVYRQAGRPAPFSTDTRTTPPHDLTDKSVLDDYPRGPGSDALNDLMSKSVEFFADHPVNLARLSAGKAPATNIWLWGLGSALHLEPFKERYAVQGAMITAVDLMRGLAALVGWKRIEVPGATGYIDTDYT
ncbi:MAG: 2,3-bisphosphoglycerate-independent phosphoglycerate mutase, partial [Thermoguttaceae bacterium]